MISSSLRQDASLADDHGLRRPTVMWWASYYSTKQWADGPHVLSTVTACHICHSLSIIQTVWVVFDLGMRDWWTFWWELSRSGWWIFLRTGMQCENWVCGPFRDLVRWFFYLLISMMHSFLPNFTANQPRVIYFPQVSNFLSFLWLLSNE